MKNIIQLNICIYFVVFFTAFPFVESRSAPEYRKVSFFTKNISLLKNAILNSPTPEAEEEWLITSSCSGNADAVVSSTGVVYNTGNVSAVLGAADGNYAQLYETNDRLVLDLTDYLNTGSTYTIRWRRGTTTSSNPNIIVEESLDNITWTINSENPFTFSNQSFFNQTLTTSSRTRYLRFTTQNDFDVDIDAVTYSNVACPDRCTGNADLVVANTGVTYSTGNASAVYGAPNGTYAQLYDTNDQLAVDLTDELDKGATYVIRWRRGTATSDIPSVRVEESRDNVNWTTATGSPFAFTNQAFFNQTIMTRGRTRYLRFTSNNVFDTDIDAISYTNTICGSGDISAEGSGFVCNSSTTQIKGYAFTDYNYNGFYDFGKDELGVSGVTVTATNAAGTTVSTTTASDGSYTFSGLSAGQRYRVEFTIPTTKSWLKPTQKGTNNGTTVQFVQAGSCAYLGLASPKDYCEDNPTIATSCFVEGKFDGPGAADPALVALPYNSDGHDYVGTTKTANFKATSLTTMDKVGATYGLGWQANKQRIYLGAFHKRYSGFGPSGPDAIYQFSTTGTLTGTIKLNTILGTTNSAGSDAHNLNTAINGEVMDIGTGNASFDGVGKRSLGDLEMSGDMKTLYVVNLFDRKIYAINVADGIAANASLVTSWNAPDATGASRHRPFALAWHKNKLWVGSVDQNGSNAYIHSLDVSGTTFTLELTVPLNYNRQTVVGADANNATNSRLANWRAWVSNPETVAYGSNAVNEISYCQPMISDIEFDGDDMILGFRDRFGDQSTGDTYFNVADANATKKTWGTSAGDILRTCYNGTNFSLETGLTGNCPGISGRDNSGPGGVEFYHWDIYSFLATWDPLLTPNGALHWETTQGGLLQVQGKPSVYTTAMDPFNDYSGGILKLDNVTGRREGQTGTDNVATTALVGGYTIYEAGDYGAAPPPSNGTFAKGNGLGDLEAFCQAAPLEIGNYVWIDTDGDGIQDANETGLSGVNVRLYDAAGTLVASTTTDANGQYYFSKDGAANQSWQTSGNSLQDNTIYYIAVGGGGQYANNRLTIGGVNYVHTVEDNDATANGDSRDSDGSVGTGLPGSALNGLIVEQITTGNVGETNHTYDFGFFRCPRISNPTAAQAVCSGVNVSSLSVTTDATGTNAISFVYFTSTKTGETMYSGGTVLGNATPSGGTASISNVSFPANTTNSPVVYYVYAILNPTPVGANCRPSQEIIVTVNNLPTLVIDEVDCGSFLDNVYSINLTTNGNTVTSTAGDVTDNGGGSFTINNVPNNNSPTVTTTITATGCQTQQTVSAPNCNCPTVDAPTNPNNPAICQGASTPTLTVNVGATETVDWYDAAFGGNLLLAGNTSYTPAGTFTAGTYTYYAETRAATGCTSNTRTPVTLTVNANPLINLVSNTPCEGEDLLLMSNASNGDGNYTYAWTGANGFTSNLANPTIAAASPDFSGIYQLTVTDGNGCTVSDNLSVLVKRDICLPVTIDVKRSGSE